MYFDADELYRRAYDIHATRYGKNHPEVATDLTNWAEMFRVQVGLNSILL